MVVRFAALALFAAMLGAQAPQAGASIEGIVTDAVTGMPLVNAVVSTNRDNVANVRTDDRGHYTFRNLNTGFYQVYGHAEGYASRSSFVRLLGSQALNGINLKLDREAVIAGRVLDRDKNPVVNTRVSLREQGFRDGRPVLTSFFAVNTNDLGEYRFTGINPGRYYLEAEPEMLTVRKVPPSDPHEERAAVIANVRTFYGNSMSFDGAATLAFTAGQLMAGLDITLLRDKTVCMTGSLAGAAIPGERYGIQLAELMPGSQSNMASGNVGTGDEFEICGIPPGSYRLRAFTTNDLRYASQTVTATDRSVIVPPLMLSPGIKLTGTVTVEGAKPGDPLPGGLRITLDPKDRIRVNGETTDAIVEASGAFTMPSVLPDEYWLRVAGQPPGYYVKQATINGREALRDPVRPGQGDLAIILASDGPTLSGTVNTAGNQPVANGVALLAVYPLPQTLGWGDIRTAFADQNGFFSFPSIPPGEYRLLTFLQLSEGAWSDPNLVRANLSKATELTLAPKEKKTLTIAACMQ
jgi:protocatechuate 3,4-dioxygenase beta subunit